MKIMLETKDKDLDKIKIIIPFEPVEDKPGYYWFNKRKYQIISEKVLKKTIKENENCNILFLSN